MRQIVNLDGIWKCTGTTPEGKALCVDAPVPGTVHMALQQAGVIRDPLAGREAVACRWVEHRVWTFEKTFCLERVEEGCLLCFEGLDVYCDIFLNGKKLGSTDNMFIEHRFSVDGLLQTGENALRVVCRPPEEETVGMKERPAAFGDWTRLYTRRIQCTYGWDWVERLVTCGIVRSVRLCRLDETELEATYFYTESVDSYSAQIRLEFRFSQVGEATFLCTEIMDPDGAVVYEDEQPIVEREMYRSVDLEKPQLWYPNGYGKPKLYTVRTEIWKKQSDGSRRLLQKEEKLGVRTVKILQRRDLPGSDYFVRCKRLQEMFADVPDVASFEQNETFFGFIVLVNGEPVMCKGANWVPCEPLRFAGNGDKIRHLLELSARAGVNMLRVWGGGVFEEECFCETCDRLGILVVQDFLMACGEYPDDEAWFREQLRREALFAVKKLRNHPCLAWWNGDNENAAAGSDEQADYPGRRGVREAVLPVLKQCDHKREAFPSSPYGGRLYASMTSGTTHNTQFMVPKFVYIRTQELDDFEAYFDRYLSRFDAEEPIMGAPSLTSLRRFMSEAEIFGTDTSTWRYRTRNNPCGEFLNYDLFQYLEIIAEKVLGTFCSPQDRLAKLQYIQYEMVRKSMELYRRNKWFSAGILYWMLNDEWPASGWALIDYYGVPKAGYYAFAQAAQPVIASLCREQGALCVYVCNDGCVDAAGTITVTSENFCGKTHSWRLSFVSAANRSAIACRIPEEELRQWTDETSVLLCTLTTEDGAKYHTRYYWTKPARVAFPTGQVTAEKRAASIVLQAQTYVQAVRLEGNYLFEDNYFAMEPGECREVRFWRLPEETAGEDVRIEVALLPGGETACIV